MSAMKIKPYIFFTLKLLNVPEETFANRWLNESGTVIVCLIHVLTFYQS